MFGRAVEANKAAAAKQPPGLAKQLFPSSSPSPAPRKPTENTIDGMWTTKPQAPPASGAARTATTTRPLQTHPLNVNVSAPGPGRVNNKIASLYSRSDSFKEEPEVIEVPDNTPRYPSNTAQTSNMTSSIILDEGDFSDDENLDLDFQSVSALPTLPQRPPATAENRDAHPPASNTSVLSWSQSSPSHHHPPPSRTAPPPRKSAKRASPDNDDPVPVVTKKVRQLPKGWKRQPAPEDEDVEERYGAAAATPAPKAKGDGFWNTTASAVKAQKKQLKTQAKESGKAEASLDDKHEAIKSHSTKAAPITLSNEQRHVKSLVVDKGQSVFFTGPAGTGKSVLMRAIIQELKKKHARDPERVAVTASTGLAACNIGGMTLHSFSGIGLGKEDTNTLVKKIRRNPKAKNRWLKTKTLVIDEVSMVDGELFDKLSQIGRIIRNNGRPWGGIQLVITGDFFQLPPVPDGGKQRESKFAFDAVTWSMSIDHTIGLTEVFRQRDPGRSSPKRLKALTGKSHRYDALDEGDIKIRDRLLANMMAPPSLELKKGAQVMLIKNMDETLVNGTLGTVVKFMSQATFEVSGGGDGAELGFDARKRAFTNALAEASKGDTTEYPLVAFHAADGTVRQILCEPEDWKVELPTGEVQASRKQLPLILAWALSIHKAQGQTLERVKVDLGKVFEKGQAYVALSRATTKQGLQVLNFQKSKVMAHARVVEFYNKLYSVEAALQKKAAGSITNYTVKQPAPAGGSARNPVSVVDEDEEEAMAAYG
ncbi:PIF1-like helicase-domain-containing protein [Parachaetomium inaequale]|uniref:ATP-dependent DNA helicase PIF1 n=1 Tax=Parachaetomium inaequale TaxID=2588326 RepID=A0AAN6PR26_9PEZI|nr:PIF1-like helicase-domain-containing protein [Parachaetomium inaequale]